MKRAREVIAKMEHAQKTAHHFEFPGRPDIIHMWEKKRTPEQIVEMIDIAPENGIIVQKTDYQIWKIYYGSKLRILERALQDPATVDEKILRKGFSASTRGFISDATKALHEYRKHFGDAYYRGLFNVAIWEAIKHAKKRIEELERKEKEMK